jgi:hypothetical protein
VNLLDPCELPFGGDVRAAVLLPTSIDMAGLEQAVTLQSPDTLHISLVIKQKYQ